MKEELHIMKIGGSCLTSADSVKLLEQIVCQTPTSMILVFSAFNGITDRLIRTINHAKENNSDALSREIHSIESFHNEIITSLYRDKPKICSEMRKFLQKIIGKVIYLLEELKEFGISPYFKDSIMAFGEKLSTTIISKFLTINQIKNIVFHGEDLIITNDQFNDAVPNLELTRRRIERDLLPKLITYHQKKVVCIEGFIGRNTSGLTTTLGRGGTDFTAAILARTLVATKKFKSISLILWKDVAGILSADPKYVKNPVHLESLSYAMAKELSFFGTKILHPKCISLIEEYQVPVVIRKFPSNGRTEHQTVISKNATKNGNKLYCISVIPEAFILSVSSETFVNVPGILGEIFSILGAHDISVNVVTQSSSEINTSFIVSKDQGPQALKILKSNSKLDEWFKMKMEPVGIVAIIGDDIALSRNQIKIYRALCEAEINPIVISQESEALNISIVLPKNVVTKAANAINEAFRQS